MPKQTTKPQTTTTPTKTRTPETKNKAATNVAPQVHDKAPVPETKKAVRQAAAKANAASDKPKKLSALDAAAKVLGEASEPMTSKAMIEAMATNGYWTSPGGQTPHATLYAAILREINVKGTVSRFQKTDRGRFALAGK